MWKSYCYYQNSFCGKEEVFESWSGSCKVTYTLKGRVRAKIYFLWLQGPAFPLPWAVSMKIRWTDKRAQECLSQDSSTVEKATTRTRHHVKCLSKNFYRMELLFHLLIKMLKEPKPSGLRFDSFLLYIDFVFEFRSRRLHFSYFALLEEKWHFIVLWAGLFFLSWFCTLFQKWHVADFTVPE